MNLKTKDKINLKTFSTKQSVEDIYNKEGLTPLEKHLIRKYFIKKGTVLDVGCGTGRTTIALDKMKYKVIGIDYSKEMIDFAKEKFPNINFEVMNATDLKYKDEAFDYVLFSYNGIDCIAPEKRRMKAIDEMMRVVKKGGIIIFSTHNPLRIPNTLWKIRVLIENIIRLNIFTHYWVEHHPFGPMYYYFKDIFSQKKELERKKYKILEIRGNKHTTKWKIRFFESFAHFVLKKI